MNKCSIDITEKDGVLKIDGYSDYSLEDSYMFVIYDSSNRRCLCLIVDFRSYSYGQSGIDMEVYSNKIFAIPDNIHTLEIGTNMKINKGVRIVGDFPVKIINILDGTSSFGVINDEKLPKGTLSNAFGQLKEYIKRIDEDNGYNFFSVNMEGPANNTHIEQANVLTNCSDFIGGKAFFGFNNLKTITLSQKPDRIPDYFVCGCSNLKTILINDEVLDINDFSSIGSYAFNGCHKLNLGEYDEKTKTLFITNPKFSAGFCSFSDMPIEHIVFTNDVHFYNYCPFKSLSKLKSITFQKNVKISGISAIVDNCPSLENINFNGNIILDYHSYSSADICIFNDCKESLNIECMKLLDIEVEGQFKKAHLTPYNLGHNKIHLHTKNTIAIFYDDFVSFRGFDTIKLNSDSWIEIRNFFSTFRDNKNIEMSNCHIESVVLDDKCSIMMLRLDSDIKGIENLFDDNKIDKFEIDELVIADSNTLSVCLSQRNLSKIAKKIYYEYNGNKYEIIFDKKLINNDNNDKYFEFFFLNFDNKCKKIIVSVHSILKNFCCVQNEDDFLYTEDNYDVVTDETFIPPLPEKVQILNAKAKFSSQKEIITKTNNIILPKGLVLRPKK